MVRQLADMVNNKGCFDLGDELGNKADPSLVKQLRLPEFSADLAKMGQATPASNSTIKGISQSHKLNEMEMPPPFILREALPVVPAKLVKRILRGEYIDMAELLKDNIEAEIRRLASTEEGCGSSRGACRGIPNLWSWLHCYSLFAAIICSKYPEKSREMWAYQATIIGEAKRCGGNGCHLYDAAFRQQISSIGRADFSKINQILIFYHLPSLCRQKSVLPKLYAFRSYSGGMCPIPRYQPGKGLDERETAEISRTFEKVSGTAKKAKDRGMFCLERWQMSTLPVLSI